MRTPLLAILFGASLGVTLGASRAEATVIVPLSVEEMSREAAAVVRGKVVSRQGAWDEEQRRIYTYTEVQVSETLHAKGSVPPTLVIRTLGGEVGNIGMKVSGTPQMTPGEEVLLFLRIDALDASQFQVIGMAQGKYRIERSASGELLAVPSVEGLAFARPDAKGNVRVERDHHDHAPGAVKLSELRQQVQAAVRAPAPKLEPNVPGQTPPAAVPQ